MAQVIRTPAGSEASVQLAGSDCRDQLARILQSPDFNATERERRFLTYIVEETLAQRAERIKAYTIAVEVFGRDASFDPQSDPVVRMEAGHLRRALERYFLMAGRADPIVISIPKGGYVPVFTLRSFPGGPPATAVELPANAKEELAPHRPRLTKRYWMAVALVALIAGAIVLSFLRTTDGPSQAMPDLPRLLVEPFEDLSQTPISPSLARGMTQEIVGQLAKFKDLVVVEARPGGEPITEPAPDRADAAPRYALAGSVYLTEETYRLQARVITRADGSVLWANSYDGELKVAQLLQTQAEIARQVASAIAQPYGVIFGADTSREVENAPDDWKAYSCTLAYYAYRANLDAKTHPSVRKCLEQAVTRFPNYATAWALLSQVYIDEIRFRFAVDPSSSSLASIDRALIAARRAVQLDPQNVRALQAEMFALYFSKEIAAALKVGEQAMAINPNDTELMGEYGYRLALSGDWDRGCPLVAEARDRNPGPLAYYESALALCAYFRGDYQQAALWIKKTTFPANPNYHVIAAAIFGEGGYEADADRERHWFVTNDPNLLINMRREVASRFARQQDMDRFIGSLKKAGLPIPD